MEYAMHELTDNENIVITYCWLETTPGLQKMTTNDAIVLLGHSALTLSIERIVILISACSKHSKSIEIQMLKNESRT